MLLSNFGWQTQVYLDTGSCIHFTLRMPSFFLLVPFTITSLLLSNPLIWITGSRWWITFKPSPVVKWCNARCMDGWLHLKDVETLAISLISGSISEMHISPHILVPMYLLVLNYPEIVGKFRYFYLSTKGVVSKGECWETQIIFSFEVFPVWQKSLYIHTFIPTSYLI